jgi:hypothetical protein
VVLHKRKILPRRASLQQKKDPQKWKRKKKEKEQKGREVKPHLPIQGHEKLHERSEDENIKKSGRDLLKRK